MVGLVSLGLLHPGPVPRLVLSAWSRVALAALGWWPLQLSAPAPLAHWMGDDTLPLSSGWMDPRAPPSQPSLLPLPCPPNGPDHTHCLSFLAHCLHPDSRGLGSHWGSREEMGSFPDCERGQEGRWGQRGHLEGGRREQEGVREVAEEGVRIRREHHHCLPKLNYTTPSCPVMYIFTYLCILVCLVEVKKEARKVFADWLYGGELCNHL